jgi:hypothetical protein
VFVIGTPKFQIATAVVSELTITLSASTPLNLALALYALVGKFNPVKIIELALKIAVVVYGIVESDFNY